ncbi:MAG TPA: hypothetical protein VL551_18405 [Actinospica sp.]|jgi:hypothetical protein|nr:hypothetical protein [Actinospica sp.]
MTQDSATSAPGFAHDILPLFRPVDIEHMAPFGVQLDQYSYMSVPANAERVYGSIEAGRMPPESDAAWSDDQLDLLRAWIDGGLRP